jgi:hypothetical protein
MLAITHAGNFSRGNVKAEVNKDLSSNYQENIKAVNLLYMP